LTADISCTLRVYVGYHTWQFGARAFADSLPWLAQNLNMSGLSETAAS